MSSDSTTSGNDAVTVEFTYLGGDYRLQLSPATASRFAKVERTFEPRHRGRRIVGSLLHRARSVH